MPKPLVLNVIIIHIEQGSEADSMAYKNADAPLAAAASAFLSAFNEYFVTVDAIFIALPV